MTDAGARGTSLSKRTTKGGGLKLLLTSGGVKNTSIRNALVELLGKPIAESTALFVPTGIYPFPGGAGMAWKALSGNSTNPLCDLGRKSLGLLELTALPTIQRESWVPTLRETDALLVWGGDVLYLRHWMQASGTGRPAAVAERNRLRRRERGEHRPDALQLRCRVRPPVRP